MSNDRSAEILREMQRKSDEYAEKSTRLSNLLTKAEDILKELPGRIEVSVGHEYCELSFERKSEGWRLSYREGNERCYVTEGPVAMKARAAQLLPELVEKLFGDIEVRASEVDAGLNALENIEFLRDSEGGDQ